MAVHYVPNPLGELEFARSAKVTAELMKRGEKIANAARGRAQMHSYHLNIVVEKSTGIGGAKVSVGSANSFAHLEEFGSSNWSGTAPLRGAVADSGLDFEMGSK